MSETNTCAQGYEVKTSKLAIACLVSSMLAIPFATLFLHIEGGTTPENPHTHLTSTICEISFCLSFLLPVVSITLGVVAFIQGIFRPYIRGWRLTLAGILISIVSLVIYFNLFARYVFAGIA